MPKENVKVIATNRKAFHDYFILERFETGVELAGTEVKSIRLGAVNLRDAFCTVKDGEIYAHGLRISPYEKGNIFNRDPLRDRRLLMHKREILRLGALVARDGCTIIPLQVYLKGPLVKVEIGLAKGKKLYDKRESESERDADREIERNMKAW